MTQVTKQYAFINYLFSLADGKNRGAMADMRRGLTGQPWTVPTLFPYIAPWVADDNRNSWQEKITYLVAALFAYYQAGSGTGIRLRTEDGNLGKHCQMMMMKENQSGSFEQRLINLLNAHPEDLPTYLRQVISLLKVNDIAINWHQLYHDLLRWNSESRYIQRQWANSYWSYQTTSEELSIEES